jgi:hypothetical protein
MQHYKSSRRQISCGLRGNSFPIAAPITWGPPTTISGPTDVSTIGTELNGAALEGNPALYAPTVNFLSSADSWFNRTTQAVVRLLDGLFKPQEPTTPRAGSLVNSVQQLTVVVGTFTARLEDLQMKMEEAQD